MIRDEAIKSIKSEIEKIMKDPNSMGDIEGCGTPEAEAKVWGLTRALSYVEEIDEYSWEELKGIAVNVVGFICNLLDYDDVITVEKLKHIDNAEEIADAVIEEWQNSI